MSTPPLRLEAISEDQDDEQPSPVSKYKVIPPPSPASPILNFKFFPKSSSLFRLKCTTTRLGLDSRRPSIEAWKQSIAGNRRLQKVQDDREKTTEEKIKSVNSSLEWLKNELIQMKKQDQSLASQFLRIKKSIYNLKLEWSCQDHKYMIEEAETEMDALEELRRVTDLPLHSDLELSLKEKGFSKLNMSIRRYSLA